MWSEQGDAGGHVESFKRGNVESTSGSTVERFNVHERSRALRVNKARGD